MSEFIPGREEIDHINAYSKSRTELGRLLSNFAHTPFICRDGTFASIEAYWYWLICAAHPNKNTLCDLHGWQAKQIGRTMASGDWRDDKEFKDKIRKACWKKIQTHERLEHLLKASTLPIVHYYSFGEPPKVVVPDRGLWIWEFYEKAREYLKANKGSK